jgi:hypothetical protein
MAEETGRLLNAAIKRGAGLGIGRSEVSRREAATVRARHILSAAAPFGIGDVMAIGTDVIHMHPAASGAALGATFDFGISSNVARLERRVAETALRGDPAGGLPQAVASPATALQPSPS